MKKQLTLLTAGILSAMLFSGCGQDPALTRFMSEIEDFCTNISGIDTSINNIDVQDDNCVTQLLGYLDNLDEEFQEFAELDFPEEFDYLESVADEAGAYMSEAVESYHKVYSGSYDATTAEYAKENYSRAYKRVQIIITFLHGEEPEDVDLATDSEE